jgi:thioesterase domain-containing protein/acyl carrier protein
MTQLQQRKLDTFLAQLRHLDVKLWAEGERLRYKAAKDALTPVLLAELRDRKTEILEFLHSASLATDVTSLTIPAVSRDLDLPLSVSQERLWYQHQFEPNSSLNNIITAYRIQGSLNIKWLHKIQSEIVRRHEILRTTFPRVNGKPTVAIAPDWDDLPITLEDLQSVLIAEREEVAHERAIAESRRPFDLEKGPLLRLHLIRVAPDDHFLSMTLHRVMADGVSVDIFFREIVTLYEAYLLNKPASLPELPIQYLDYAYWQRQKLQGEFLATNLRYWKQHLEGPIPVLNLPTSRPRPSVQSFNTLRRRLIFPKTLNDALNALGQQEETTLFTTLLAALKVLLYRYSGKDDLVICCSNAGRNRAEVEPLIGPFFNTLALRTHLDGDPSFRELLDRAKKTTLDGFAHQELPFEQLVAELGTSNNRGRSPLFQMFFALNPSWKDGNTLSSVELPGIVFDTMFGYLYTGKTKFDLFLVARESEEGLQLLFEYNSDIFDGDIIEPMMDYFRTLLESIVANPDEPISKLFLLTPAEQKQLLEEWNRSETYILDRYLQPTPMGVLGEVYLGGSKLNKENLIASPFKPGECLYKTGKLARYLPDGSIEYIDQETESADQESVAPVKEKNYVASRDAIEEQLAEIWERVLNIKPIGIQDNFFDLGGHSVLAVRLFSQIEETFGKNLPLSTLLQSSTIELQAKLLREDDLTDAWSPLVEIKAGDPNKPPLFCIHGGGFNILIYRHVAESLDPDQAVYGLQARGLDGDRGSIADRLEDLATDYIQQIKTVQPQGPYLLAGLSNGGNIALEMAQQLLDRGEKVSLLAMFDCYAPDGMKLLPPKPRFFSSLLYALRYSLPRFAAKTREKGLPAILSQIVKRFKPSRQENHLEENKTTTQRIEATRPGTVTKKLDLDRWMNRVSEYIITHSPWSFFTPKAQLKEVEGSLSNTLKELEETYTKIHKAYTVKPYAGRILLFRASECPPGYHVDSQLGWGKIASEGVEVYKIPGHHTSLMVSPILGEHLQACVEKIQNELQKHEIQSPMKEERMLIKISDR